MIWLDVWTWTENSLLDVRFLSFQFKKDIRGTFSEQPAQKPQITGNCLASIYLKTLFLLKVQCKSVKIWFKSVKECNNTLYSCLAVQIILINAYVKLFQRKNRFQCSCELVKSRPTSKIQNYVGKSYVYISFQSKIWISMHHRNHAYGRTFYFWNKHYVHSLKVFFPHIHVLYTTTGTHCLFHSSLQKNTSLQI